MDLSSPPVVQTEMVPEVEDSLAVGLRVDGDVEMVLFVKLVPMAEGGGRGGEEGHASQNVSDKRFCECARRFLETVQDYICAICAVRLRTVRCTIGTMQRGQRSKQSYRVEDCHDLHDPTVSGLVYFDTLTRFS